MSEQALAHSNSADLTTKYTRTSLADLELMLQLKAKGKTQAEIAAALNVSQSTVSHALAKVERTPALIQALAKSEAPEMLNRWIRASKVAAKRGDHRPARERAKAVWTSRAMRRAIRRGTLPRWRLLPLDSSVSSITRSGSTATVTMAASHGWATGDYVADC